MAVNLTQAFPNINAPLGAGKLESGEAISVEITPSFKYFLETLWKRTGESDNPAQGISSAQVEADASAAVASANAAVLTANAAGVAAANALAAAGSAQGSANSAQITANSALALATTSLQEGDAVAGWGAPSGSGSRTSFSMDVLLPVSGAYSQAEVTAIAAQVIVLQKRLGQLEIDLLTLGGIKT